MAYASSLSHLPLLAVLFFYPYSSSCMHCSSHAGIATPVFYQAYMAAPLTLILRSQYQGTIHSLAWGRWQKCLCFPSVFMREKEREPRERAQGAISGEWEMTGPVIRYFPLWDFWAGFSVRSLWDVCDMNLISLCLCCCLAVSDPLSSITGLLAMAMALLMAPLICLLIRPDPGL